MKTITKSAMLAAALGFGSLASAQCPTDIGCFTSIKPTAQTRNLIIAKEHRFQAIFKQGDAYTNPLGALTHVPGNHDFTAYTPINGSSELGHLSINHENTPGGVSILDIHFDQATKLWVVDTSRPVDFYNNDLVTTTRNCSGGITPWGTVITSEETSNGGDANNDGYQDVGWLVEFDPRTGKVMDYDNDGVQDKLWAIGRSSKENALIMNDSVTVYTGEDGGSSAVFKFVADTPGNLSSGKLYALKLDGGLSNREPVLPTGSWVLIPNATQADRNNARGLARAAGATNFNGVEDIEVGTIDGKIYFAAKGNNRVYRFDDNGSTVSAFETYVGGTSYDITTDEGVFTEPWSYGNDNLTFDDKGNLWVLQDGDRDYIWVVRPGHTQANPQVEIFASFPISSEPTGLTFSPDYRFGFVSVQHPSSGNNPQRDASGELVNFNASYTLVFALADNLGYDDTTLVSDESWTESRVVTPTNLSGAWSGVSGDLPAAPNEYKVAATLGQPYGYPSIYQIEGTEVIKTGNSITYFRKEFNLTSTDWNIEMQTTVDDQADIYINGVQVALINTFGRMNYKAAPHTATFMGGTNATGVNGGDSYGYLTNANLDTVLVEGNNEVVIAVRNLGKNTDMGGFSFRMDLTKAPLVAKSAVANASAPQIGIYPNPTNGEILVNIPQNEAVSSHTVSLYDINGRVLSSKEVSHNEVRMDLSSYANGVYFIKINSGETVITEKVVKK
jgi:hypothetical protein